MWNLAMQQLVFGRKDDVGKAHFSSESFPRSLRWRHLS
jgi:hypothetical protein